MIKTPLIILSITSLYLIFCTYLGPKLMKNKQLYVLGGPMFIYNITMVIVNLYFFIKSVSYLEFGKVFLNFPSRTDQSDFVMEFINFKFSYLLSKFVDFFDTIFFVLRKKYNQISVLHLYDHASVPVIVWLTLKIGPTVPGGLLFATLNSLIQ